MPRIVASVCRAGWHSGAGRCSGAHPRAEGEKRKTPNSLVLIVDPDWFRAQSGAMSISSAACHGIEWRECNPADLGVDRLKLSRVIELVEARGAKAQLCVIFRGRVLIDRSFGCNADSLFWIFSACKPYTALLVHILAERRQVSLDDPVSEYWPEFASQGKDRITIRHVLQHRSGLFSGRVSIGDALAMANWRYSVRRIEDARPRWPPGVVPAYQALPYGFILGEHTSGHGQPNPGGSGYGTA